MLDGMDLFNACHRDKLAWLETAEPGYLAMSLLTSIDVDLLTADEAVTYVQVHDRLSSWWAALQVPAMVAAAGVERRVDEYKVIDTRPGHDEARKIFIEDAAREEIATATRWSFAATHDRIETARLLRGPLYDTWQALGLGEISVGHVAVLVEACASLPGRWSKSECDRREFAASCDALQQRVLPVAMCGTLAATRKAARRAVLEIGAASERRRREAARASRRVYLADDVDGMSTLVAYLPTEWAHAVMHAIDLKRTACAGSASTTADEQRADALVALVLEARDGSSDAPRLRAQLDVVIGLDALLGLNDEPAELRGCGPISPDVVRDLLADPQVEATMRRLVADPVNGHLLDVGRRRYEIPQRLREFIVTRDGHCRFPGCHRRATECQVDHALAWADGGSTTRANLGALCTRHHQLKTHGGWEIRRSEVDGACVWLSPAGRAHEVGARPMLRSRDQATTGPPRKVIVS